MSLISILIMMFILASIGATILFAVIRVVFVKHRRKIYAHQVVKHAADKLPYQIEQAAYYQQYTDTGDTGDWVYSEDTGKFTQTLYDGTIVTWDNDPSGQVRTERHAAETGAVRRAHEAELREQHHQDKLKTIHNGINSDWWMMRVNR